MGNPLRLIDVSRLVLEEIEHVVYKSPKRLLHDDQLRKAAQSISANIREAYGRRAGAERNQFFRYARGSAEETDEHLRTNFVTSRIPPRRYWQMHNRLIVIQRMLTTLMADDA